MKYAIVRLDGVPEIRQDASDELPPDAIPLTDEQHAGLLSRSLVVANGQVVPAPPPTAEELAARAAVIAQATADAAAKSIAKADTVVQYLRDHTPAEVEAYVQTNVTDLASARQMMKKFAVVLCVLAKQAFRE
jgi:hypothetical protein